MTALLLWYPHAEVGAPLRKVAGLTLVRRAVLAARKVGFRDIAVATHPRDAEAVRAEAENLAQVVAAPADPGALWAALPSRPDECALALGDRVWLHPLLERFVAPLDADRDARIAAARAGLVRVRRSTLGSLAAPDDDALAGLGEKAGDRADWVPPGDGACTVDGEAGIEKAERMLLRALVKPADGIISRNINRKISTAITRQLAGTEVRPNHVTFFVLLIGLCAFPFARTGSYAGFAAGALCYYLSAILDGVDGELARLKYAGSAAGTWFDTITDDVVGLAWLCGMYLGLAQGANASLWAPVGGCAIVLTVASVLGRYYVLLIHVGVGDHQRLAKLDAPARPPATPLARLVATIKETLFRTDFLPFFAAVTAVAGVVEVFALPYALGAVAALIDTARVIHKFGRGARDLTA